VSSFKGTAPSSAFGGSRLPRRARSRHLPKSMPPSSMQGVKERAATTRRPARLGAAPPGFTCFVRGPLPRTGACRDPRQFANTTILCTLFVYGLLLRGCPPWTKSTDSRVRPTPLSPPAVPGASQAPPLRGPSLRYTRELLGDPSICQNDCFSWSLRGKCGNSFYFMALLPLAKTPCVSWNQTATPTLSTTSRASASFVFLAPHFRVVSFMFFFEKVCVDRI